MEVIIWLHSAWTGKDYRDIAIEREKPVETFQPGKRDYLLSNSTFSGNFPVGHTAKTLSICPRTWIFGIFNWPNGKRQVLHMACVHSLTIRYVYSRPTCTVTFLPALRQVTFFSLVLTFKHFCLFVVCRACHRLHNFPHFFSRRISKECTLKSDSP